MTFHVIHCNGRQQFESCPHPKLPIFLRRSTLYCWRSGDLFSVFLRLHPLANIMSPLFVTAINMQLKLTQNLSRFYSRLETYTPSARAAVRVHLLPAVQLMGFSTVLRCSWNTLRLIRMVAPILRHSGTGYLACCCGTSRLKNRTILLIVLFMITYTTRLFTLRIKKTRDDFIFLGKLWKVFLSVNYMLNITGFLNLYTCAIKYIVFLYVTDLKFWNT